MTALGHCPSCARSFTAAEIAGYGIIRARTARAGGPLVELPCQGCGRQLRLIPHGEGRYALPGQPPPPPVPTGHRRPPWMRDPQPETPAQGAPANSPAAGSPADRSAAERPAVEEPVTDAASEEAPRWEVEDPDRAAKGPGSASALPGGEDEDEPLTPQSALALLGVGPDASPGDLERAFRRRSKTCHPDKVAHLDEDFQRLAERKFKRLHRAFELLMGAGPAGAGA